jgi:hypothetical protein
MAEQPQDILEPGGTRWRHPPAVPSVSQADQVVPWKISVHICRKFHGIEQNLISLGALAFYAPISPSSLVLISVVGMVLGHQRRKQMSTVSVVDAGGEDISNLRFTKHHHSIIAAALVHDLLFGVRCAHRTS